MNEITVTQSKGLRNDTGTKFVSKDYFYQIENFNYDDIIGCSKINLPSVDYNVGGAAGIDGIYQFRYINSSSTLVKENIVVVGGAVVKNAIDTVSVATTIYSGLTPGHKCTFAVLNDQLFISNGYDNILVYKDLSGTPYVKEMGAPLAQNLSAAGVLTGAYYYALTYVVNGVELITGTISNTVNPSSNSITLTLPVGPTDTAERKIYRTEAGGTDLKLLATISDNTTTIYVDNIADGSLGADMGSVNSAAPKPQFISVKDERLIGVGNTARPNYFYTSETEVEVMFNTIGVTDVSGQGNDNTSLTGMALDYDQIVVFSEITVYIIALGTATTVQQTNANVGCLDGFSIAKVPNNATFKGGLMFVSTEYDIRIFNGNIATTLATSLDNLKTQNFSEQINKTTLRNTMTNTPLEGEFYDYKYHLIVGSLMYVYDIRILGWTTYRIKTASYAPTYRKLALVDDSLYVGQSGTGIVEKMYQNTLYRSEPVIAEFETPELLTDNQYKYFHEIHFYYGNSGTLTTNITITPDNNSDLAKQCSFALQSDGFDSAYFDPAYFKTITNIDDYKVLHVGMYARWLRIRVTSNGKLNFRGYRLVFKIINNKEAA
jgi:hypothetical protein